ncbi:MAG: hypothetical protein C4524_09010 [Candidatus Zixiibacteriota bacterium]|nr:MAG: hypothetical protein C4524_09010 [candidate division Zixibacteria bacterium]
MSDDFDLRAFRLEEVRRIMRKQLAAWCDPGKLTPEEIAAVNQIIASSAAARYPDVAAVLNATDLGQALQGEAAGGSQAQQMFIACVIQACHRGGLRLRTTGWPSSLSGRTIESLSGEVLDA